MMSIRGGHASYKPVESRNRVSISQCFVCLVAKAMVVKNLQCLTSISGSIFLMFLNRCRSIEGRWGVLRVLFGVKIAEKCESDPSRRGFTEKLWRYLPMRSSCLKNRSFAFHIRCQHGLRGFGGATTGDHEFM